MGHGFRNARTFTSRKRNDDSREIMLTKEKYIGKLFNNKNKLFFETLHDAVWLDYMLCKKLRGNDTSVLGLNACTIIAC